MRGNAEPTAPLRRAALEQALKTQRVGRQVHWYESVGSTNAALHALAAQGVPDGTVAVAEHQTAGRGRRDRHWWAPPRTCLLFSVLFRPASFLPPSQAHQLTMLCALATRQAIAAETGLEPALKWPNDLLLAGRKVGGVLTESAFTGRALTWVVVGVGVNVNLSFEAEGHGPDAQGLAPLRTQITSLMAHLGRPVDRSALLRAALEEIDARYRRLEEGARYHEEWTRHLATLGQAVRVETDARVLEGLAEDVDEEGSLLLRLADGSQQRILVGDVTQLR